MINPLPVDGGEQKRSVGAIVILIGVMVAIFAIQNVFVVRASLDALSEFGDSGALFWLYLFFGLLKLILSSASVLLIVNLKKRISIVILIICLAYCGVAASHLENYILEPYGQRVQFSAISRLMSTTSVISMAAIVYLLLSRQVEAVYGMATRDWILSLRARLRSR